MAGHDIAPNVVTYVTALRVSAAAGDSSFFGDVLDDLVALTPGQEPDDREAGDGGDGQKENGNTTANDRGASGVGALPTSANRVQQIAAAAALASAARACNLPLCEAAMAAAMAMGVVMDASTVAAALRELMPATGAGGDGDGDGDAKAAGAGQVGGAVGAVGEVNDVGAAAGTAEPAEGHDALVRSWEERGLLAAGQADAVAAAAVALSAAAASSDLDSAAARPSNSHYPEGIGTKSQAMMRAADGRYSATAGASVGDVRGAGVGGGGGGGGGGGLTIGPGCLGPGSPANLRREVMEHDLGQLLERIGRGVEVSTLEFETLIHQCRKRKWCDEVTLVLTTMAMLGREGVDGSATLEAEGRSRAKAKAKDTSTGTAEKKKEEEEEEEEEEGESGDAEGEAEGGMRELWSRWVPSHGLPPQPQVLPTHTTLMGALDAYIDMGAVDVAWEVIVHDMESSWEVIL